MGISKKLSNQILRQYKIIEPLLELYLMDLDTETTSPVGPALEKALTSFNQLLIETSPKTYVPDEVLIEGKLVVLSPKKNLVNVRSHNLNKFIVSDEIQDLLNFQRIDLWMGSLDSIASVKDADKHYLSQDTLSLCRKAHALEPVTNSELKLLNDPRLFSDDGIPEVSQKKLEYCQALYIAVNERSIKQLSEGDDFEDFQEVNVP